MKPAAGLLAINADLKHRFTVCCVSAQTITPHYIPTMLYTLSLFFCCYEQVYDMPCLEVVLQVRSRDGMSTPQNGAAAYSQSHYNILSRVVSSWLPCGFRPPECPSPMVGLS